MLSFLVYSNSYISFSEIEDPLLDKLLSASSDDSKVSRVLTAVKAPAFAVFMSFAVTLALFPTITSRIESESKCDSDNR